MKSVNLSSFFILLFYAVNLHSQNTMAVGVTPFFYKKSVSSENANILRAYLKQKIPDLSTVSMIDREQWKNIQQELDAQKMPESRKAELVEQGKILGAKKLVYGEVHKCTEEKIQGKNDMKVTISITIGVLDVETGATDKEKLFQFSGQPRMSLLPDKNDLPVNIITTTTGDISLTDHMAAALQNWDKQLSNFLQEVFGGEWPEPTPVKKFSIASHQGNTLLIQGAKNDKIKKSSQFVLVEEISRTFTGPNGDIISGTEVVKIAEFKFLEDRGDFTLLELDKKYGQSVDEILKGKVGSAMLYIRFKESVLRF